MDLTLLDFPCVFSTIWTQSVTCGHDWETFRSTVIGWRSARSSRCDIPGTTPYCNGTVRRCVPQFVPCTFTLLEQLSWCWCASLLVFLSIWLLRAAGSGSERHLSSCSKLPSTPQCWSMERRYLSCKRGYRHIFQSSVTAFHGVQGIPVTGQLSCQLLHIVALLLLVLHTLLLRQPLVWWLCLRLTQRVRSDPLENHFQSSIRWWTSAWPRHCQLCWTTVLWNVLLVIRHRFADRHRVTLPTCIPSALLRTGHDGTFLGSLPVVSPVLRLLLWSYCGSATMLVSGGVFLTQSGVCAVVWLWATHRLPGEPGTRVLWMSCRDPRVWPRLQDETRSKRQPCWCVVGSKCSSVVVAGLCGLVFSCTRVLNSSKKRSKKV